LIQFRSDRVELIQFRSDRVESIQFRSDRVESIQFRPGRSRDAPIDGDTDGQTGVLECPSYDGGDIRPSRP